MSISHWKQAMNDEFAALLRNNTWHLVPLQPGRNVINCKWVYKDKHKVDGSVDRYKAHLVAKCFKKCLSIDYDDTFNPVLKPDTIRLVLSIAVSQGWTIRQLDIQNAFLHNVLEEDVFMKQPWIHNFHPITVSWTRPYMASSRCLGYGILSDNLYSLGFQSSKVDISLFIYRKGAVTMFMLMHADDISIASSSPMAVDALLRDLSADFALKDLGPLHYFLGIQVTHTDFGLILSQ
jgi:hypothetical protein